MAALSCGGVHADTWSSGNLVTPAERLEEILVKEARIGTLMVARGLDGVLLTRARNHAWILAGSDTRISRCSADSSVWLLIARGGKKFLIGDNGEAPRIMAEEGLRELGWTERRFPWFAGSGAFRDERKRIVEDLLPKAKVGCDAPIGDTEDITADLARLRFPLTSTEMRRMRWLGSRAAGAVSMVCREIAPGMRESGVQGMLSAKLARDGLDPVVVLVGSDERLMAWRDPVPTEAKVKQGALVGLVAGKWGLVVAVSRLVHFGAVPLDMEGRMKAAATVEAAYLKSARPGATLGLILMEGAEAYAAAGWAEEWRNRYQGGSIAYAEREAPMGPESTEAVVEGMALVFATTLPGVRLEDTILVGPHGPEILTRIAGWPVRKVMLDGAVWEIPDILVRAVPAGHK